MPRSSSIAILAAAFLCAGCRNDFPDPAAQLRGIGMNHALSRQDSLAFAAYGSVIAMVRIDSAIVVLTDADDPQLRQVPGVVTVGVPQGHDVTSPIETCLGVIPASLTRAMAVAAAIGVVEHGSLGPVDACARVPANRLSLLDTFPDLTDVYLNFDPIQLESRAARVSRTTGSSTAPQ